MKLKRLVPIITLGEFAGIKEFYQKHFNFKVTYEAAEFLSLSPKNHESIELAFMKSGSDGQPEYNNQGLTYCFEVDDVDAEYERLNGESVTILQQVQSNPWGDRSFIVEAPAGVSLYIYSPIPPAEEFKQYHKS